MRRPFSGRMIATALAAMLAPAAAHAQDILAAAPHDLSVTIYRDPDRDRGGFDLNALGGFALVTETRRVVLIPGEHRLRFEGVADGIEPASAIVTGLPDGVLEKNRDAALLSPSALVDAAQAEGGRVLLTRTNPATGETVRTQGLIRSAADGGVVFETPQGVEALRCSGLSETFAFEKAPASLSARPTLSVLTRVAKRTEAVVQLSYLARGFDWSADYVATMQASPGKLSLGGWVTLANGNGAGFPDARVQIVAGSLNRASGEVEPISIGQPILALCWPRGSTSDTPAPIRIERAFPFGFDPNRFPIPMPAPMASMARMQEDAVAMTQKALYVSEAEALGDLKLYRIPDRTTLASRQSKQVRLLDRAGVTVKRIYETDLSADASTSFEPMTILLRTTNDKANNLGLPLPSGRVSVFETSGTGAAARRLLSAQTSLRDLAVNEETELRLGQSPDVQVRQTLESRQARTPALAPVPGADLRRPIMDQISHIAIANARPHPVEVEVRLYLEQGSAIMRADHPPQVKNGRPIFRVLVPANSTRDIRYQTTRP